jgi:dipeptidyl aminopeptidase/acylaminoacyl peptidase
MFYPGKALFRSLSAAFVLALFVSHGVLAEEKPALSLEETVGLKSASSALMSPNGDAIAYLLSVPRTLYEDKDGSSYRQLHVVTTEGVSRPYFSGKVSVSHVAWSPDGNSLLFTAKRDPAADFADIYRMPLNGGEAEVIYKAKTSIKSIHPSPDGKTIAFRASEPKPKETKQLKEKGFKAIVYEESDPLVHVWLLDIESGEAAAQDLAGSVSNVAWAPGGDAYAVAMAPTPMIDDEYMESDIFVVSASDAKIRNQMGSTGKMGAFAWSPNGEQIAWIGAVDMHDPSEGRLYTASSTGGERVELLPAYQGHVDDFYWNDNDSITWLGSRGVWTETGRAVLNDIREAGEAPDSGPIVRSIDARPGQQAAAAIADSPEHPPEVYLLQQGAAPKRLTNSNPILAERRLAQQEVVTFTARDGMELEMMVVHPFEKTRGGSPLIMVIHGGPEAHYSNGWNTAYSRPAQTLAGQGYLLAFPNYRGSTGRGVEFSKLSQHAYGEAEFNDIVDAKMHLVEAGLADVDRTGITGGSYGGYASMWAASALTEHFAASVAFVGISDQISKFGTTNIPKEMFNVHARAWPWDDWMWMLERSPIYYAGQVKTPLLIMHGADDPRVHPAQSLEMYRHVKVRTDTPVRLVWYPGEGHGNSKTAARYDYALRLERWMNHFLRGEGEDLPPYEIDHAARLKSENDG